MKKTTLTTLIQEAESAQKNAHAPYSGFKVGAAVLSTSGTVHAGCNVENTAYPLGQCAEATAIGNMITEGGSRLDAVVIQSPTNEPCYPCGGCRQKIAEFADDSVPVILVTRSGTTQQTTVGELLPHAFRYTHPTQKAG
ncbi:cytidine deaminase [Alteromonas salexigens]